MNGLPNPDRTIASPIFDPLLQLRNICRLKIDLKMGIDIDHCLDGESMATIGAATNHSWKTSADTAASHIIRDWFPHSRMPILWRPQYSFQSCAIIWLRREVLHRSRVRHTLLDSPWERRSSGGRCKTYLPTLWRRPLRSSCRETHRRGLQAVGVTEGIFGSNCKFLPLSHCLLILCDNSIVV